jgi:hypothetical protein
MNGQERLTVRNGERNATIILHKINGLKRFQNQDYGTDTERSWYINVHVSKTKEKLYLKFLNPLKDPNKNFKNSNSFVIDA